MSFQKFSNFFTQLNLAFRCWNGWEYSRLFHVVEVSRNMKVFQMLPEVAIICGFLRPTTLCGFSFVSLNGTHGVETVVDLGRLIVQVWERLPDVFTERPDDLAARRLVRACVSVHFRQERLSARRQLQWFCLKLKPPLACCPDLNNGYNFAVSGTSIPTERHITDSLQICTNVPYTST